MNCTTTTDLCITRGDTKSYTITVKNEAGVSLIEPGTKLWFTVKRGYNDADADALIALAYPVSSSLADYTITLDSTKTKLDLGSYYYDIQFMKTTGEIFTPLKGKFQVTYDVTKADS